MGIPNDRSLNIIVSKSFSIPEIIILFQKLSELIKYSENLCYLSMIIKKFISELY